MPILKPKRTTATVWLASFCLDGASKRSNLTCCKFRNINRFVTIRRHKTSAGRFSNNSSERNILLKPRSTSASRADLGEENEHFDELIS